MSIIIKSKWPTVNLDQLCDIVIGRTPSRSVAEYWGAGYNWLSISDMNSSRYITHTKETITEAGSSVCGNRLVHPNTVVLYFKLSIGKVGIVQIPMYTNEAIAALPIKNKSKLDETYLYYALNTLDISKGSDRAVMGQTLNKKKLEKIQIPLPPLEEQKRIAAILDKADAIRRKRQQAIALTEELLKSTFLEMFGDPVTNPKGWEVVELGNILLNIESGWSPKCDSRKAEAEEWGVLKLGAITWGHFNESENKALFTDTIPHPELEVKTGDLLFSRKNTYELVGATAFVYSTRPKLMLSDLIFRLCLSNVVDPVYLWQALSQKTMRIELSRLASGTSGSMPNISKNKLRKLSISIPPLELQLKYRKIADNFWNLQNKHKYYLLDANNLFNSLLQRAFKGEL